MSRVEEALTKLGVEHRRQGERVWAERCPLPTHGAINEAHRWQNFFVRADGPGLFHCFSCKGGGNLVELVMLLRGVDYRDAQAWLRDLGEQETEAPFLRVRSEVAGTRGTIAVPEGVERMGAPYREWNTVPRTYAESRGITERQVGRWRVGYALDGRLAGRLFLPIYDSRGRLANYAARDFVGAEKRYLAAGTWEGPDTNVLFGEHRWPTSEPGFRETVVLTEGALNALAIERAAGGRDLAYGGMSGLDESEGGQVDVRTLTKLATFRRVVVATDPDGPGRRVAVAVAHALRRQCAVVRLELPDGTDAADLPRDALAGLLGAALGRSAA